MILFEGTEDEIELKKELLNTLLELDKYRDSYDKMRSVEEIEERIKSKEEFLKEDFIDEDKRLMCKGEIEGLNWVLNNSKNPEYYKSKLPRASRKDVVRIIKNFNKLYKQMTIDDYIKESDNNE